jgi:hypothetical protein
VDSLSLVQRLLQSREVRIELGDGLHVVARRPAEGELHAYIKARHDVDTHLRCVVGWGGFSEATLLGAEVGSSDPLPFDPELWLQAARDRVEWISAVAEGIGQAIEQHAASREAIAKNSPPSSTKPKASSGRATKRR